MNTLYLWLVVAGIALVLELVTPAFLFICFTGGALVAALSTIWIDQITFQAVIFAVVSVVLIPLTRPVARKMSRKDAAKTNVDALMGRTAYVLQDIDAAQNTGRVRIGGEQWRAIAETPIPAETEVIVTQVKGTTVTVAPKN
jgi:membrane protein implicated in regulation of membrane protease activity